MRYRSENINSAPTWSCSHAALGELNLPQEDGYKYTSKLRISTMEDDPGPGRHVKQCSQNVANASVISLSDAVMRRYYWGAQDPFGQFTVSLSRIGVIPVANPIAQDVPWSDMAASLSEKLSGRIRSKSLLAVTIRELPSTIGMIRNPYRLLRKNWRLKCGMKTASALAKEGANIWLETQYGWNALNYDMGNFAQAYSRILSYANVAKAGSFDEKLSETRQLSGGEPYSVLDTSGWSFYRTGMINIWSRGCFTTATLFCRAAKARAQLGHLDYMLNSLGLDNRAILASLWEVIPFSFVADWFIKLPNIMAPLDFSQLASESVQLGYQACTEWRFVAGYYGGILDRLWDTGYWDWQGTQPFMGSPGYKRIYSRYPGLPQVEGVRLSADLSSTQLLSLGSLLIQNKDRILKGF